MQIADVVLQHLLAEGRAGDGAEWAAGAVLSSAASQLGVLSSARQADGLVGELCSKARSLLGSKQAVVRRQGLELLAGLIANSDRRTFLSSQLEWFTAVAALLRGEQPADVAAAGWACLAALFARIHRMLEIPGVRRDGATMVPKFVALLQQRQQEAGSPEAAVPLLTPAAMQALLAALGALPAPFRQHSKALEPLLCAALTQPGAPPSEMRLAAACVASLPRINGDGASWSAMAQRLLASAHRLLDALLLGLEDQSLVGTARELLDPQAQPLPGLPDPSSTPLPAYKAAFGQLEAVGEALQELLTRPYPSAVPLPSMGLLLLVSRVLGVDDASAGPGGKPGSSKFCELCVRLPALHCLALRLLRTLLRVAGAQMAPLFLTTARLLGEYLGRVAAGGAGAVTPCAPAVRCRLYAATAELLQSAGVGVARPLGPALLCCARWELYGDSPEGSGKAAEDDAGAKRPPAKKRRRSKGGAGAEAEDGALGGAPNDDTGAAAAQLGLAAQAQMLAALEALLTSGAALLAPADRAQVDAMAAHMSSTTAGAAQRLSQDADGDAGPLAPLQLAAHRALQASVLAPMGHRPAHLPLALRLFRSGLRAGSPQLSAFCSQALLNCEALLHPRSAPLAAPLRPLAAAAPAGQLGFGAMVTAHGALGAAGEGTNSGVQLGKPAFWSYLDSAAAVAAGAGDEALPGAALTQRQQQAEQQQGNQAQGPGWGADQGGSGDVDMEEAPQQQQQQPALQQQLQAPSPAALGPAAPPAAIAAPGAKQQQQQQHRSSMAAVLAGGCAKPVVAVPPAQAVAVGSSAMQAGSLPEQQRQQPAAQSPAAPRQPPALQPGAPAAEQLGLLGARAAGQPVALGEGDSDSDGPMPEIDSGDEGSSSEEEGESRG